MTPVRSRFHRFLAGALATAILGAALCTRGDTGARPRPNIVVIVLDTVRADHLPFYGYARDTAPFLTRLAKQSVVFDQAYSTSGWTSPATASLFTSLYPFQHGVVAGIHQMRDRQFRFHRLPSKIEGLARSMRSAGYATYAVSDNVNVSPLTGFEPGFDLFESASDASAVAVNKRVKKWRQEMEAREPYFLYLHYLDAHEPYLPKAPWFDQFLADGRPGLTRRDSEAAYDSEIRFLDERIEGLYNDLGWDRGTVVVVTADHGEEFGDHGHSGHAHSLYSELVNVPLLVHGLHGREDGRRIPAAVSLIDILPTLRHLVGLPQDPANEGVSLLPLLSGTRWVHGERTLFSELVRFETGEVLHSAVRRRFKMVVAPESGSMLFDLSRDPRETQDVAAGNPAILQALRDAYATYDRHARRWADDAGRGAETSLDPASIETLRALGYVR